MAVTSGRPMRRRRFLTRPAVPSRSRSRRAKNPATMKNSDMRKMWMTKKAMPRVALVDLSAMGQFSAPNPGR